MMTSKTLTQLGVQHFIIVEPQEIKQYEESIKENKLLTKVLELDLEYKKRYELCDKHGLSKSTGSGPARNFAWDHSVKQGADRHWIMDDNIRSFRRLHNNERVTVADGTIFKVMEDFVLRYRNVAMAGPHYMFFVPAKSKQPAFVPNSRIFSCNLIKNDVGLRWRGRYNEDIILSLDMLKAGWCTILFKAFLQEKMQTQQMKGGNTTELYAGTGEKCGKYAKDGTTAKSQMLVDVHPDVARLTWRFNRVHHHVDFRPFRKNKLVRKERLQVTGVNNYGMKVVAQENTEKTRT